MDGKEYLSGALRDAILIDAMHRALFAMRLTNGSNIEMAGSPGVLHFDHEIECLRRALCLLGIDPREPLPIPAGGRDTRNSG